MYSGQVKNKTGTFYCGQFIYYNLLFDVQIYVRLCYLGVTALATGSIVTHISEVGEKEQYWTCSVLDNRKPGVQRIKGMLLDLLQIM